MNRLVKKIGCAACLVGLMATMGGHWLVFQSFAWASMIVDFSHEGTLRQAISRTFDGQHPCVLCHFVEHGRQQEQAENKNLPSVKPDEAANLWCAPPRAILPLPPTAATEAVPFVPRWHLDFLQPPPTPPPRAA